MSKCKEAFLVSIKQKLQVVRMHYARFFLSLWYL